jgi:hypothetical protein
MKLNRLETHDRYKHFTGQDFDIGACCQNLIDQRPFGQHPFYIFTHARTIDLDERIAIFNLDLQRSLTDPTYIRLYHRLENVPEKKVIWQPRLTRPTPQTNSYLFKAYPGSDVVKVIWMIPDRAMWSQYEKGKVTANETIMQSINDFENNRELLARKEPDDLQDWEIDSIYRELSIEAKRKNISG